MNAYDREYLVVLRRIAEALEEILKELKEQRPPKWVGGPK